MNYLTKYSKNDFPLLKLDLLRLPARLLKTLFLLMNCGEAVIVGGAAAAIQLGEYEGVGDIDLIISYYALDHIYNHFATTDLQVYWDVNYYGDPKCAIFFPVSTGFHKLEVSFRIQIPPSLSKKIIVNDVVYALPCASCEWILANKLEKIIRPGFNEKQHNKFAGHVETSIKLAKHMICKKLTIHPKFIACAKNILSLKYHDQQSLLRLSTLISMIETANT